VQIHLRRSYHYSTTTAPTKHNHRLHYSYDEPTIKSCPVQIDGLSTGALRPRQGSSLVCRVVGFWFLVLAETRYATADSIDSSDSEGRIGWPAPPLPPPHPAGSGCISGSISGRREMRRGESVHRSDRDARSQR